MKVSFSEKLGYSLGDGAANLVFQLMMMFQLFFYTDVLGIGAGAAGAVLLGARILDAFVDPLAGILADRTNSRWGKYRPWVAGTAIPFAVLFALSFLSPDWGERAKIAWAAATYSLLMVFYSFNNTPYSSLGGVMTDDGRERTSVATVRFVAATIATIIVQACTLPLVGMLGRGDAKSGWAATVGIYAVAAAVLLVVSAASAKERIAPPPTQKTDLKRDLKDVFSDVPWRAMFVLTLFLFVTLAMWGSAMTYFFDYAVPKDGSVVSFSTFNAVGQGVTFVAVVTLPGFLSSRFGKKATFIVCLALAAHVQAKEAVFEGFVYDGRDEVRQNPVLRGMAPDPSVTRKGEWFYMANSSFSYWPGIPVWRSKNLMDWEFVDFALKRKSQFDPRPGIGLSRGVFAPDIKYNPYNDTFYLLVTLVDGGGNVLYKTKDPAKGWSDPVKLGFMGIDPGIYFEDAKTAYIVNNDDAPDGKPEYPGHRTIRCRPYDLENDVCLNGQETILVNKGIRPEEKPIWCEGPHIYKVDGAYWLMTAEGGTAKNHSEVIWKGDSPMGPFKPCAKNPILTQRDLPDDRENPVTAAGHADLVQDCEGKWWAVFLGIVPYRDAKGALFCNTGRSTFLLPVEWIGEGEDSQPMILEAGSTIPWNIDGATVAKSSLESEQSPWFQVRTPAETWYWREDGGKVRIAAREETLDGTGNPSFLCNWIKDKAFSAEVKVSFDADCDGDFAGLAYYQDERHYYAIGKTNGAVALRKADRAQSREIARIPAEGDVRLRIVSDGPVVRFYASSDDGDWRQIGADEDATILSTDYAGGFVGATIGFYATSAQRGLFAWFLDLF